MKEQYECQLKNIYLEELNLNKINSENQMSIKEERNGKKSAHAIELSGTIMYGVNDSDLIRYIFACEFIDKDSFEISIVYDTYFHVQETNGVDGSNGYDEDELISIFNRAIWPYVVEQINTLTSKMDIEEKITLPSYGVIMDEQ